MHTALAIGFLVLFFYCLIQFARFEHVQEDYENAVGDVEGRLEWARTRTRFPFGMKAQLDLSNRLLRRAQNLWKENKWHQAYRDICHAQKAMNKAQRIYRSATRTR